MLLDAQLFEEAAEDLEREEGVPAVPLAARRSTKLSRRLVAKAEQRWRQRLESFSWRLQPCYASGDVLVREVLDWRDVFFSVGDASRRLCAMGFSPPVVRRVLSSSCWSLEEAVARLLADSGDVAGAACWPLPRSTVAAAVSPLAASPQSSVAAAAQVLTEVRLGLLPASPAASMLQSPELELSTADAVGSEKGATAGLCAHATCLSHPQVGDAGLVLGCPRHDHSLYFFDRTTTVTDGFSVFQQVDGEDARVAHCRRLARAQRLH
jgi:hypothetical protein